MPRAAFVVPQMPAIRSEFWLRLPSWDTDFLKPLGYARPERVGPYWPLMHVSLQASFEVAIRVELRSNMNTRDEAPHSLMADIC